LIDVIKTHARAEQHKVAAGTWRLPRSRSRR